MKNKEKGLPPLREIISVCERAKKNKRDFSLAVRHTQKNYCNWFDNSEIIQSLSRDFSLQSERVFHVNICILVYDCYFELLIYVIILFGTQQIEFEEGSRNKEKMKMKSWLRKQWTFWYWRRLECMLEMSIYGYVG